MGIFDTLSLVGATLQDAGRAKSGQQGNALQTILADQQRRRTLTALQQSLPSLVGSEAAARLSQLPPEALPQLLMPILAKTFEPQTPITPYQQAELDLQRQAGLRADKQLDPAFLQARSAAEAAGQASAPISAAQQAQLDQAKALASPQYRASLAAAETQARLAAENSPANIAAKVRLAGQEASAKDAATNVPYDPETIHFMAEQALAGDRSVFAQMGYGGAGQKNRAALRNEVMRLGKERNLSGADLAALNAEFAGLQAGERTLGNRTANIEMAASEVEQLAPLALQASQAVDRTRFPALNAILLAGELGTGDENVVRLGQATNSLINTYARAISPSGTPTVSDKDHAREILSNAWSKGQYAAAIDQMQKEIAAARRSPGAVRGEFRAAISGTGGPGGIAPVPGAPEPRVNLPSGWSVRVK